jgi:single-strand DNA-binding protein
MASSVNKIFLVGNLGADPEIRTMGSGGEFARLSVATSDTWKDRETGERREKTEWHRVVIWDENLARICKQFLKKGSKVHLEGAIQTRIYTDQDGVERSSTEIVLNRGRGVLTMLGSAPRQGSPESLVGVTQPPRVDAEPPTPQPPQRATQSPRPEPPRVETQPPRPEPPRKGTKPEAAQQRYKPRDWDIPDFEEGSPKPGWKNLGRYQ